MRCDILSPGPSLSDVKGKHLWSPTNRYAVNRAIRRDDLCPHNWVIKDELTFKFHHDVLSRNQILWCPYDWIEKKNWEHEGSPLHEERIKESFFTVPNRRTYPGGHVTMNNALGWERGNRLKWGSTSTFAAMWVAIMQGATQIRLWGSDFKGQGSAKEYFEDEKKADYNDSYWKNIRKLYEELKEACHENGVTVSREFVD